MKNVSQLFLGLISAIGTTALVLAAASLALLEGGAGAISAVPATQTPLSNTPSPLPPVLIITATQPVTPTVTPTEELSCKGTPADWLPYTVQQGDTIVSLVIKSGVTTAEFLKANCFKSDGQSLEPGWLVYIPPTFPTATPTLTPTLVLPTPTLCGPPPGWVNYVVQPGDTLFRLSLVLGISQYQLQSANCLANTMIYAGTILHVPFIPPIATRTPTPTRTPVDTNTPVPPTWTPTHTPTTPVPAMQDQTITFGPLANKTYGDTPFDISATASSGLTVTFSAAGNCSISGNTVTLTGAGSCTITASQAGDSTYNPAVSVPQTFQIAKEDQTIDFIQPADKTVLDSSFIVNATASSGLAVSFTASGNCTITGSTVSLTGLGNCSIIASQSGNENYNAAVSITRSFQIIKASQSISFDLLPNKAADDPPFTVSATATSGLTVSFEASGNCSIAVNTVTLTGAGSCSITASQTGNENYDSAVPVTRTFLIN